MLLLFDIDGTLIRGRGAGRRALGRAFQEVYDVADIESVMDRVEFNGRTDPQIIRAVAVSAGMVAADYEPRLPDLVSTYLRHLETLAGESGGAHPCPGFPELLEALEPRPGVVLGLLTGNIEAGARIKLEPFDLNRFFPDGGYGSDAEERPVIAGIARRKFERRLDRTFDPDRVVVIGDTVHDVTCGQANGFRTIAVGTGGVPEARLRSVGPDVYLPDFGNIAAVLRLLEDGFQLPA